MKSKTITCLALLLFVSAGFLHAQEKTSWYVDNEEYKLWVQWPEGSYVEYGVSVGKEKADLKGDQASLRYTLAQKLENGLLLKMIKKHEGKEVAESYVFIPKMFNHKKMKALHMPTGATLVKEEVKYQLPNTGLLLCDLKQIKNEAYSVALMTNDRVPGGMVSLLVSKPGYVELKKLTKFVIADPEEHDEFKNTVAGLRTQAEAYRMQANNIMIQGRALTPEEIAFVQELRKVAEELKMVAKNLEAIKVPSQKAPELEKVDIE